jgi:two-component system, chemotaxis family, CheB/CheR fusion protein
LSGFQPRGPAEWHRFAVDRAAVGIAQLGPDGAISDSNAAFAAMLGAEAGELVGKSLDARFDADDAVLSRRWAQRAAAGEVNAYAFEARATRSDGAEVWLELSCSVARDAEGGVAYTVVVAKDVTALRGAERALRKRVGNFFRAFDAVPAPMLQTDPDTGRVLRANRRFQELTGYAEQELLDLTLAQLTHPEDRGEQPQRLSGFTPERRYLRKDGSVFWAILYATPLLHDAGGVFRTMSAWVDVTERKRAEEGLRLSEERFRTLVEAGPVLVYTTGPDGRPNYLDPSLTRYLGIESEALRDPELVRRIVHPEDLPRTEEVRTRAPLTSAMELRLRRADGAWRWFLVRTTALFDDEGRFVQRVGSLTDIHERKTAEAALLEDDRRKDEFLAMLAHELRNPLGAIRNAVEVLRLGPVDPQELDWARDMIGRQVGQLTRLVDDLLEVSRITRGTLALRTEAVDVSQLFRDVAEASTELIAEREHELLVSVPHEPLVLQADPARLAQVLANLLDNAAKNSPPGGRITLAADREDGLAVIEVRDEGRGMTPEELSRAFEMFYQAAGGSSRQTGLGVGLALVKRLVELHGGGVEAHSEGLARGSCFRVRLPLVGAERRLDALRAAPSPQPPARRRRVLVVDDNPDSTNSLAALVTLLGHDVDTAADGVEACEVAERVRPDVVLLDLGMPRLDGFAAAERIRATPWGARALLVAQTGWGREADRRRTAEAGFDHHLTKPIDPAALRRILAEAAAPERA